MAPLELRALRRSFCPLSCINTGEGGIGFPAPDSFIATDSPKRGTPRSVFQDGKRPNPAPLPANREENHGPGAIDPAGFTLMPHFGDSAFPSRYSYAIGLGDIRFLGWKTPPLHSALPTTATLRRHARRQRVPGYYRSAPLHRGSPPLCARPSHSARRLQDGN